MFYLNCLATCEDVRHQNREAFELYALGDNPEESEQQDLDPNIEYSQNGDESEETKLKFVGGHFAESLKLGQDQSLLDSF